MLGQSLLEVHNEQHYHRLEAYVARALAGESVTFEFAETNINNQERYMLRSYVPNRLDTGEVVGIFVLIRDITERRRTAEALHQAYQNLELRVRERTAELTTLNDQLLREIDERRRAESRLREAKLEAEQANLSKTKTCCNRSTLRGCLPAPCWNAGSRWPTKFWCVMSAIPWRTWKTCWVRWWIFPNSMLG